MRSKSIVISVIVFAAALVVVSFYIYYT